MNTRILMTGLIVLVSLGAGSGAAWAGKAEKSKKSTQPLSLVLVKQVREGQTSTPLAQSPNTRPPNASPRLKKSKPVGYKNYGQKRPRLTLVIDDIGHSLKRTKEFLDLGLPMTYAILPHMPHTKSSARAITQAGAEYIVHLPMEPISYPQVFPGPIPLLLKLSARTTTSRMQNYFTQLPHALGASSHMGSAYTADWGKMRLVQGLLSKKKLLFLNSRTIGTDVPQQVARQIGLPYLERDVFLDNNPDEKAIAGQLEKALELARQKGHAIAIGHPYPQTLKVLRRAFRNRKGVMLVPLSRFSKNQTPQVWRSGLSSNIQ